MMKHIKSMIMVLLIAGMMTAFGAIASASTDTYAVKGVDIYLALRTAKAYDASNEIGRLYEGETVEVQSYDAGTYWYVYSPKLNKYGYVNADYLTYVGGDSPVGSYYSVKVDSGYLALRTAKAFNASNEIGALYTGDSVYVQDASDSTYWYVYSPKHDRYGYVNKNYLRSVAASSNYSVKVDSGYLALRTAKAFNASNEIGKLYTGDTVTVQDTSDSTYWYVYSPKHNKYGYVNKNYLIGGSSVSGTAYSVKVSSGYLALRTAMAYDASNEIGALYTGDTVYLQQKTSSTYWYVYSPKYNKYGYVNRNYLR